MRPRAALRLALAAACSWLLVYQVCDRYGDSFKAAAAQVLAAREGPAIARSPAKDRDAWMPLVLGQTLVPGPAAPAVRAALARADAPDTFAFAVRTPPAARGRSPPRAALFARILPPRLLAADASVRILAPPLA